MKYDNKEIESLITLLNKWELTEIAVENGDSKIKIKKEAITMPAQIVASSNVAQGAAVANLTNEAAADDRNTIKSPMVGTVYLSSSPGSPNFVSEGSVVKKGDVLCLIEAMKMFNKIKSEKSGTVRKILTKNEQPIEFGAPLFVVDEN
jgi:acetyl-CoA carboxylase biotin carboxyl carrier protein